MAEYQEKQAMSIQKQRIHFNIKMVKHHLITESWSLRIFKMNSNQKWQQITIFTILLGDGNIFSFFNFTNSIVLRHLKFERRDHKTGEGTKGQTLNNPDASKNTEAMQICLSM